MTTDHDAIERELLHAAKREACERTNLHAGLASQRRLSDGFELVGVQGEIEFAIRAGLPLPLGAPILSDGGIDFNVPLRFTIDVKTARKPLHLIQEEGKVIADIYVLAGYDEGMGRATLIGWEYGLVLRRSPTKDFGHGIVSHFIPAERLRGMDDLFARIARIS